MARRSSTRKAGTPEEGDRGSASVRRPQGQAAYGSLGLLTQNSTG